MTEVEDIKAWKRATRLGAIDRRAQMEPARKRDLDARINENLRGALLEVLAHGVVGFCWPYKGEFDLRFLIRELRERGAVAALPVVVQRGQAMIFRRWWPGAPMIPGAYDIPVPDGTPLAVPDALFAPLNAFDEAGFRLGYGGGFFDRTLASIEPQPIALGVAYEEQRIATIHPTEYDIPMDFIVTDARWYRHIDGRIEPVSNAECAAALAALMHQRGLPRSLPD